MPALLDDPTSPPTYRTSGPMTQDSTGSRVLPPSIQPRQVTLRDRTTIASLLPISGRHSVPQKLLQFLCDLLNSEIEQGDTYPMVDQLSVEAFGKYWFANFGAIMVLGEVNGVTTLAEMEAQGVEWKHTCLGSFYVKPNYPGRSSHVCNGGFLVSNASRNRGVGKLMGEGYLDWAPKLGYIYSVFNLVYETNHASIRIWDSLGFKRIGRVKGCGNLRSHPGSYIDAIIFGRDLGPESEDYISEERFDKIRFYLKHQKYPVGADRAEKSRLRSAATHYHLIPGGPGDEEKLMLKDKEVIADTQKQYEIARQMHCQTHGGINKTTATIAEKYHWVRIKETVSLVIKNCPECKESNKVASTYGSKVDSTGNSPSGKNISQIMATSSQAPQTISDETLSQQQMAPPQVQKKSSHTAPQTHQAQHQTALLNSYDNTVQSAISGGSSISRSPSAARQSPSNLENSASAATSMGAPSHPMTHVAVPQKVSNANLPQGSTIQDQLTQPLIPPHLNNLNNIGNLNNLGSHLGLASANISPQESAVHSPLANGPASAPITGIHEPFDMQIDPNLLANIQNANYSDLTGTGMDTTIQGIGNLDMDANMHGIADLNVMGLGDTSMQGLSDHSQVGHSIQSSSVNLGELSQGQDSNAHVMNQSPPQEGQEIKREISGIANDGMMLDSDMNIGR